MKLRRRIGRGVTRFRRRLPVRCPDGWSYGPPDFVGWGAQKAGTTWWHHVIETHPSVTPIRVKELHYLRSKPEPLTPAAIERYHRFFPRPPGNIAGEWTPGYLLDPTAVFRLAEAAPDAKVLVLLRDPIERFRSALAMHERNGTIDDRMESSRRRGHYAEQVSHLLEHVERDRVLILQYERVVDDPRVAIAATYRHLGIDDGWVPPDLTARRNAAPVPKRVLDDALQRELLDRYADDLARLATMDLDLDLTRWPTAVTLGLA